MKDDHQEWCVGTSNQHIDCALIHHLKDVLDVLKRKERMVQRRTQVQREKTSGID